MHGIVKHMICTDSNFPCLKIVIFKIKQKNKKRTQKNKKDKQISKFSDSIYHLRSKEVDFLQICNLDC